jgi:hypothetical protein
LKRQAADKSDANMGDGHMSSMLTKLSPGFSCAASALALAVGMLMPAGARAADEAAGLVLHVSGVWFQEPAAAKKLSDGDQLPAGATIYPQEAGPKTFIVVCLYTGVAKTYKNRTTLPDQVEPSLASRIWTAIHGHYRGGVVHAISRGDELTDCVAKLTPQGIDVAPLMRQFTAGSYLLRFRASDAARRSEGETAPVNVTVDWDPEKKQTIVAGELTAGLYVVELLDNRSRQPTGSEAVVLARDAEEYERTGKAYADAVASTKAWDEQARHSGAGSYLRSYLAVLADEDSKETGPAKQSDPPDKRAATK